MTGQITDLAVHTKLGATSGVVWVTRVSDGTAVPGAALALYDGDGAVKWQGKTDGDGLRAFPDSPPCSARARGPAASGTTTEVRASRWSPRR